MPAREVGWSAAEDGRGAGPGGGGGVEAGGEGYGEAPPALTVAPPPARGGADKGGGRAARGRAVMRPTGRWRAVRVVDGGAGYEGDTTEVATHRRR